MTSALARIGPSESQSMAMAARPARPVKVYRDLREALVWFEEMWSPALANVARLHGGYATVEPGDMLGGPEWHRRFARFLLDGAEHYDPVRMAWARMRYHGTMSERAGAMFLFVLACRDLDLHAAGLAVAGHCLCSPVHLPECRCDDPAEGRHQHGPCPLPSMPVFDEWVAWVAERAIDRLRWYIEHEPPARPIAEQPEWMRRAGFTPGFSLAGGDGADG